MKAITIRGIDPEIAEKLKSAAAGEGKSVNQFLLEMIKNTMGYSKKKRFTKKYDDLDELFGKWTEEEFKEIQGKIDSERKTDPELWR